MTKPSRKWLLPGFSLIEISLVLLIMGVLMGSVLKGRSILDQARARAVAQDFLRLQTVILLYSSDYNPTHTALADKIWEKLHTVNMLPSAAAPSSQFGGNFAVVRFTNGHYYLRLGADDLAQTAILTPAQVRAICARLESTGSDTLVIQDQSGKAVTSLPEKTDQKYTVAMRLF